MQQFMRKFEQLNGVEAKVVLEHRLFDGQVFHCDELKIINDDEKIGVMIKNKNIFIYKPNVKVAEEKNGAYIISDGRMTISIYK